MQTTHKIAGGSATGYAAYLTNPSDRGDYHTTARAEGGGEGQDNGVGGAQGRWHGSPELLARLGLSPDGPVQRDQLTLLMNGISPADGTELRPVGANGTRVAGIDLTFSAPKSVSALWAVSGPAERAQIEAAHGGAIASTLERMEREVALVRTRSAGEARHERSSSVLAAEFMHTSSRLTRDQERGGVPDPQLHSHVVVLVAERMDGRFAAVDSRELFRAARANGAWYRAELAHGLRRLGLEVKGRTGRDERYFEVSGVPERLTELWSARSVEIERAAARFRDRYGRDPRAGELGALTVNTRGTKAAAAVNVNEAWRAMGAEHGLTREQARDMFTGVDRSLQQGLSGQPGRDLASELLGAVTKERSMVSERDLRARSYELAAGVCPPAQADRVIEQLARSGELVRLEGGLWTTRELREREQQTLTLAGSRAAQQVALASESSLRAAQRDVQREIRAPLSPEQREALQVITGPGGVNVLVGQAGTGKGVVISAAAGAWQREGYRIGTAVAGATAERLGADAKLDQSLTTDALLGRVESGRMSLNAETVVVMDEAGMADTRRLASLVELTAKSESKLVLVGDAAQLPSIGAGGMFAALQEKVPTAQVSEVHRAQQAWEREAWKQVREGRSQQALAAYKADGRLHISETLEQAVEKMVADWDRDRQQNPGERTVMLTDAANVELDRINTLAQEHRANGNELGSERVELPDRPYGFASGDQVTFSGAMFVPGEKRVENGTRGTVIDANSEEQQLTIRHVRCPFA